MSMDPRVGELDKPWYCRKTSWAFLVAVLAGLGGFADQIIPVLPDRYAAGLRFLAVLSAALASLFARMGGVAVAGLVRQEMREAEPAEENAVIVEGE